jgi:hypothetical protein
LRTLSSADLAVRSDTVTGFSELTGTMMVRPPSKKMASALPIWAGGLGLLGATVGCGPVP